MKTRGFTIVELLIVIVIIAILAAIIIVTYNGIQNKAADSAVQVDLRNMGGKASAFMATNSTGAPPAATEAGLKDIVKVSKGSYLIRANISLIYCWADDRFAFVAASKSGNVYVYSSQGGGVRSAGPWAGNGTFASCISPNTTNDSAFAAVEDGENIILLQSVWESWI
jgi:prepilin-type N-terminal cleavage/methylation domain-containing protein